jgi:hypothetical protein
MYEFVVCIGEYEHAVERTVRDAFSVASECGGHVFVRINGKLFRVMRP